MMECLNQDWEPHLDLDSSKPLMLTLLKSLILILHLLLAIVIIILESNMCFHFLCLFALC